MKRILIPTDFSLGAEKAFEYALQIARRMAGEIILLHVCALPIPEYAERPEGLKDYNKLQALELQKQLDRIRMTVPEEEWVSVKTLLVDGDTIDVILEKSRQYDVDLIVMGTRGAGPLKALLFGTRTAAVMAASNIPVIAVPEEYEGGAPDNILLAVQQDERDSVLAPAFRLRALFGAKMKAIVFSGEKEPVEELIEHSHTISEVTSKWREAFSASDIQSEHIVGEDFCGSVDRYVDDCAVRLLVMVTHQKGGLRRLFHASLTRKMACHSRIPLMSLHA
jgi:nucleotide-binding universal stress UspA family protein